MPGGGFVRLPAGSVVVALSLPRPDGTGREREHRVRVLVHSVNRQRALTRLRNLGLRAVYLRGNTQPPTPDEVTAVLHHPDGLVWRGTPEDDTESWHPIGSLLRAPEVASASADRPRAHDTAARAARNPLRTPTAPRRSGVPRPAVPAAESRWYDSTGQDNWLPAEFRAGHA